MKGKLAPPPHTIPTWAPISLDGERWLPRGCVYAELHPHGTAHTCTQDPGELEETAFMLAGTARGGEGGKEEMRKHR